MRRILALACFSALFAATAFCGDGDLLLLKGGRGADGWWKGSALTFWAPFDNPSDPLRLIKGTGSLSFTRATTATYVHPTTGLITTAASGQLRIEANGALIERQRTNLAKYSEQLGLAANWVVSNVTVDNNTVQAPTGDNTAETLTATADNATLLQSYTGTVEAYTVSYYLKRKTGTGAVQVSADNTTWTSCTINASTWTRCSDTRTVTVATYYHGVRLATSGDAVYAWGGDAELGAFNSSYIPTEAAAVTRNGDVLKFASSGNVSSSVGTAAATFRLNNIPVSGTIGMLMAGSTAYFLYTNSFASFAVYDGTNVIQKGGALSALILYKGASRWGDGALGILLNGGAITAGSFDGTMNTSTDITIGSFESSSYLFGHIKNLRIWNRAFTDSELQAITQ